MCPSKSPCLVCASPFYSSIPRLPSHSQWFHSYKLRQSCRMSDRSLFLIHYIFNGVIFFEQQKLNHNQGRTTKAKLCNHSSLLSFSLPPSLSSFFTLIADMSLAWRRAEEVVHAKGIGEKALLQESVFGSRSSLPPSAPFDVRRNPATLASDRSLGQIIQEPGGLQTCSIPESQVQQGPSVCAHRRENTPPHRTRGAKQKTGAITDHF